MSTATLSSATVGSGSVTRLVTAGTRISCMIRVGNVRVGTPADVYLAQNSSDPGTANSIKLQAGEVFVDTETTGDWYAITNGGSISVFVEVVT